MTAVGPHFRVKCAYMSEINHKRFGTAGMLTAFCSVLDTLEMEALREMTGKKCQFMLNS